MREDLHYHCIDILAKAAGFKEHDALTIAYASQYVDDSTESEPIQVGDMIFGPVRTAHSGLESFEWSVQERVHSASLHPTQTVRFIPGQFRHPGRFHVCAHDMGGGDSERCDMWREAFEDLLEPKKFSYDPLQWRREALNPNKDIAWDDFDRLDFKHLQFAMTPNFYDTPWAQFHRAALMQQHFVLERLL
jgi:hypothetical protein